MATGRRPYKEPQRVSELLPRLMREIVPRPGSALDALRRAWPGVVGASTASRARPTGLKEGTLTVRVASAAVKHDLSVFRGGEVLRALADAVPEAHLRAIRYHVGA